jgi:hypothetical protein
MQIICKECGKAWSDGINALDILGITYPESDSDLCPDCQAKHNAPTEYTVRPGDNQDGYLYDPVRKRNIEVFEDDPATYGIDLQTMQVIAMQRIKYTDNVSTRIMYAPFLRSEFKIIDGAPADRALNVQRFVNQAEDIHLSDEFVKTVAGADAKAYLNDYLAGQCSGAFRLLANMRWELK